MEGTPGRCRAARPARLLHASVCHECARSLPVGRPGQPTDCILFSAHGPPPNPVQGELLLVAMQLMMGGSLRAALVDPERRDMLRWSNL